MIDEQAFPRSALLWPAFEARGCGSKTAATPGLRAEP